MHAGLMALRLRGRWSGALISGPSGSGKSDLALRLLGQDWRLVADDRTLVWRSGGRLFGRAPDSLSGLIEARGVGVLHAPTLPFCEIVLAVLLEPEDQRIPEPERRIVENVALPAIRLASLEASAAQKLALRMQTIAKLGACD